MVGLRVDQVKGAVQITAKDIEISKAINTGACPVTGVAKLDDGLILIHDLGTCLQDAEAADLDTAMAAAMS